MSYKGWIIKEVLGGFLITNEWNTYNKFIPGDDFKKAENYIKRLPKVFTKNEYFKERYGKGALYG